MPASKLVAERDHQGACFSVIGAYSTEPFVAHVGLLNSERRIRYGSAVLVTHVCPPLQTSEQRAHVVGWLDNTSAANVQTIRMWLDDIRTRMPPSIGVTQKRVDQYSLRPPIAEVRDEVTGRRSYFRFSCTGFVVKCYEDCLAVRLLEWRGDAFPAMSWAQIETYYPPALASLLRKHKDAMGLDGEGPWRLMLPGHLIRALDRSREEIDRGPYDPKSFADSFYP